MVLAISDLSSYCPFFKYLFLLQRWHKNRKKKQKAWLKPMIILFSSWFCVLAPEIFCMGQLDGSRSNVCDQMEN